MARATCSHYFTELAWQFHAGNRRRGRRHAYQAVNRFARLRSYAFASRLGLKLAVLENKEGTFVKPTQQSCTVALATAEMPDNLRIFVPDPSGLDAYPIVTFSWILLYKDYPGAEKATSIRDLFQWCLLDGQNCAKLGYVPLPTSITEKALATLNTVGPRERL